MTMHEIKEAVLILAATTSLVLVLGYWWLRLSAFCAGQEW